MGLFSFDSASFDVIALMDKRLNARGISVGNAEAFGHMVRFIEAQGVKSPIHRVFDLASAKDAYQAQRFPDLFGKVVIEIT